MCTCVTNHKHYFTFSKNVLFFRTLANDKETSHLPYSPELKAFALTLNFYSGKAYRYTQHIKNLLYFFIYKAVIDVFNIFISDMCVILSILHSLILVQSHLGTLASMDNQAFLVNCELNIKYIYV